MAHKFASHWVRSANSISWVLFGCAVVAYLWLAFIIAGSFLEIVPQLVLGNSNPTMSVVLAIVLVILITIAPIIFSLLPHTSCRSLMQAYHAGGVTALDDMGRQVWIIAVGTQILSWAALTLVVGGILYGFSQSGMGFGSFEQRLKDIHSGFLWILIFPMAILFVPGCLRLPTLIFLFRRR